MGYRVVVAGATGNVGREMLNILAEREFPIDEIAVVASARILFEENATSCEVAISVADAWQLHGIGKRLMDALLAQARTHHRTGMHGMIPSNNRRRINFMRRRDFEINNSAEGASLKIARLVLQRG